MISLVELIPSRAVRERCILENRVFDLREQAKSLVRGEGSLEMFTAEML